MPYPPNPTWVDLPSTATPMLAAKLNHIEQGLVAAGLVYNVKDPQYLGGAVGAVGDGVTDDYAAIMAAYTAIPNVTNGIKGGVLWFPPGFYHLSATLQMSTQNLCLMASEGAAGQWFSTGTIGSTVIMSPPGLPAFQFNQGSSAAIFAGPMIRNLTFTAPFNKLSGAQVLAATMNVQSTTFLPSSGTANVQDGDSVGVFTYTGKTGTTLTGCTIVSETNAGHTYANASTVASSTPYGAKLSRTNNFRVVGCNFHGYLDPTPTTTLDDGSTVLTGSTGLIVDGSVGICQYGRVHDSRFYGCNRAAQEHTTSTRWSYCDIDLSENAALPVIGSIGHNALVMKTLTFDHVNIHGADIGRQANGNNVAVGWSDIGGRYETWRTAAINVIGAPLGVIIPNSMNNFQGGAIGTGVALDANTHDCLVLAKNIVSCVTPVNDLGTSNHVIGATATFNNAGTVAAVQVKQTGSASASTSTGGAINLDNSGSTGAGLVVYSTQASPSGRLIVGRANSATFAQTAIYGENAGTGHAIHGSQTAGSSNTTGSAGNFTSTNPGASCVQISGVETGRGSLKITHTGPGTNADANASAISIDLQGASTAAQGLHIDSVAQGTAGALLDLRNNGNQLLKLLSDSTFAVPILQFGNGGPLVTINAGSPAGVVAAPPGSICLNSLGGAGTTLYVKESGTGTSGWVAK